MKGDGRDRSERRRAARTGPDAGTGRVRWPLAVLLLAVAACAKQEPPPGAAPDQAPPEIREVVPADGAVVPDLDEPLRIRFDEPVEAPRGLARRLEASPVAEYRVDFGFDEIRVRPEEGWLAGAVYHIRLPGGINDLLNNEREDSLEVTFSTGPPITDTRVTGRIVNRVDRQPQRGARALFLAVEGDSVPYGAVADTGGRFELTAVPPGVYRAYAFRDLNANRDLERRLEPWDSTTFRLPDARATAELDLSLLEPDSTPPRLVLAEAIDSAAVELTFDDHLDPARPPRPTAVTMTGPDGDTVSVAAVGITRAAAGLVPDDTAGRDTAGAAAPDSAPPGDALFPDTTRPPAAAADTVPARDTVAEADTVSKDTVPADTLPLPSRRIYLRTARTLRDSARYRVRVRGLHNLQGLTGGGDTTFVYLPAPDTAAADTAARGTAPSDTATGTDTTATVPPDTLAVPDTAPAGGAPSDTTAARDGAAREAAGDDDAVPDSAAGGDP